MGTFLTGVGAAAIVAPEWIVSVVKVGSAVRLNVITRNFALVRISSLGVKNFGSTVFAWYVNCLSKELFKHEELLLEIYVWNYKDLNVKSSQIEFSIKSTTTFSDFAVATKLLKTCPNFTRRNRMFTYKRHDILTIALILSLWVSHGNLQRTSSIHLVFKIGAQTFHNRIVHDILINIQHIIKCLPAFFVWSSIYHYDDALSIVEHC